MIERLLLALDDRLGTAHFVRKALRKAFPDHWSFMLGEINVYCFLILIATGTYLALFFHPSSSDTVYNGAYAPLHGDTMSEAYASAVRLSFDVDGGLLLRQVHHWAALIFLAGIVAHMTRIFLTGAFRKPREINWVLGVILFMLAMFAGFSGYSLPDDLLSGSGLRIADAVLLSIPVVGAWASILLLGGVFPTHELIPRLFVVHVFIMPAMIAGAIALHLAILWRQKHAQFRGPGRTEHNVVGSPLVPNYAAKSLGLLFACVAVTFALGAAVQINPVWLWGPYHPWEALNPAQPDWYVGWLDGALRLSPPLAAVLWGHRIPSPFWPAVLMPMLLFAVLIGWPWIEAGLTGDRHAHNLLDRPRDKPWRTAAGMALFTFTLGLTLAGSGDVQARYTHLSITTITQLYRIFCIAGPVIAYVLTYAVARELKAQHGVHAAPRVQLRRNAQGGFDEEVL